MNEASISAIDRKLKHWKSKLIDLSLRNRLLNFRQTKTGSVQITQPPINDIFDWLVKREKPMIFVWREINQQELFQLTETDDEQDSNEFPDELHTLLLKPGELATNLDDSQLARVLYNLRLRSRTALEEQGVNVLFVAFGFLEWTESQSSDRKLRSPLVLAPVELIRETVTNPYKVSLLDEDVVLNPTLMQKMQSDFGIALSELPDDLDSVNLPEVFSQVEEVIRNQPNWSIVPEVYLGLFSFTKLIMYKDLEEHADLAKAHPIIAALASDNSLLPSIPEDLPTADDLDEQIPPQETYQILDADSSQQEAIIAAKRGVSFVLQGPPGTGKSQTIANIIAECLAADKTVLFVSEKMAALEVVQKRLNECGLAEFCLEIHSHKVSKRTVVEELGKTLDALPKAGSNTFDAELTQLQNY